MQFGLQYRIRFSFDHFYKRYLIIEIVLLTPKMSIAFVVFEFEVIRFSHETDRIFLFTGSFSRLFQR